VLYARPLSIIATVLSAIGLLAAAGAAGAGRAPGALDPSFGNDGLARVAGIRSCLPGEGGCPLSVGLVIQPDGAVLIAGGTLEPDCTSRFALARLREGNLDQRFGRGGIILTGFGSRSAVATAMGAMPDHGMVLVGELKEPEGDNCVNPGAHLHLGGAPGFVLARYQSDGRLDRRFDGDGRAVTNLEEGNATDVLVQPDGKVIVVGSSANRLVLMRYDRTGALDSSFGSDGTVLDGLGGFVGHGAAALDGSGRILVATSHNCAPCPSSLARFTRDGRLDPSFGRGGRTFLPTRSLQLQAVAVARGKIIAAGAEWFGRRRLVIARLAPSGHLDLSFDRRGLAALPVPRTTFVNDVAIQRNGRIVVLTTRIPFQTPKARIDFTLTRLSTNGSLDRTFGRAGTATADFGFSDVGEALSIQPDGQLVVAGVIGDRPGPLRADAIGVARYLP
jgi:uncharacterized delta-60 repeat protein